MELREIFLLVIGSGMALVGRFIWDRFLSQSSRVTVKEFKNKMDQVEKQLAEGQETFKKIGSCITASCLIMLQLCKNANIDCEQIEKKMIEAGMNL